MNKFRVLKIHSKYRVRTWDSTIVPEIRLEGKWLEKLGFESGKKVIIEQEKNRLILAIKKEKTAKY